MSTPAFTPYESKARIHAHVAFAAFLIGLPLGTLMARYLRTFTNSWFWPHVIVNLLFTGPIVLTAFALGYQATNIAGVPHFVDPHQKTGLALFRDVPHPSSSGHSSSTGSSSHPDSPADAPRKLPTRHLGLAIIALACFQTHFGMWNEWPFVTGKRAPHRREIQALLARHCHCYLVSLCYRASLLPRQFRQEAAARHDAKEEHEG
ncbi:hypothetical protein B0H14DRAFT_3163073 [Mycena olivaceomarginata]|nr:hypothetical protein B0H14DRAFT_3163073 [Mycena olivaceomarginata]